MVLAVEAVQAKKASNFGTTSTASFCPHRNFILGHHKCQLNDQVAVLPTVNTSISTIEDFCQFYLCYMDEQHKNAKASMCYEYHGSFIHRLVLVQHNKGSIIYTRAFIFSCSSDIYPNHQNTWPLLGSKMKLRSYGEKKKRLMRKNKNIRKHQVNNCGNYSVTLKKGYTTKCK